MKKTSTGQMIILNMYWLGLSFKWNTIHPLILPAVLLNFVPDAQKNSYLGILTFVGLIIATIIQPVAGAISDRWRSRFGRRRPMILAGTLLDLFFLALLGWAGGLIWLMLGYILLQFSSNIGQGASQGLLPDRVPSNQLGLASGIKTFIDMLALILASLVAGNLIDPVTRDPSVIISVVMVLMVISTAITIIGTPEESTIAAEQKPINLKSIFLEFQQTFQVDLKENIPYWLLIAERFLFLMGVFGIQQFAQYFIKDVLQVENPLKTTGDMMAALAVGLVITALIGGWLSDRFGPKLILIMASIITGLGCFLLLLVTDQTSLVIMGSVIGVGMGLFLTSNWAIANQLAPGNEAGKYIGLTNIATAGAGAIGRLWGPFLDWLNQAWIGSWWGYKAMFIFGGICTLSSIFLLIKIKVPDNLQIGLQPK
ncbi:MFS transporter [Chloroflexota bacterium]